MVSALTVLLLSCWLARRSGVSGQGSYPKPSISVSPGEVIPVGGNITIQCQHQHLGLRFVLYKNKNKNNLTYKDPAGYMAEFPITSARREHGGSYTCHYSNRTIQTAYSEPSDPVQIIVAEPSYPKPSISLSPSGGVSLGGDVTFWCRGQRRGVRFVLNKERFHFPPVDTDDNEAVFPIRNVRREHGGSYSCYYHNRSKPFAVSYPSDPVELVVRDPSLPRPSISLSPTGVTAPGADVTIRCQGQRRDVSFFLHKAGDQNPPRHMDPAGDGAEFRIPTVGRQHGGSYNCSYRPRSEPFISSEPSEPVQLVVGGGSESPAPTSGIIAGVSAAAAVLLLLLVAFVCFRKTRARKGATPRPSSPLGVLKAPAQEDPIYASMDEGKEPQTLDPEPDTYAELDGQTLQPSVYGVINVNQGVPE